MLNTCPEAGPAREMSPAAAACGRAVAIQKLLRQRSIRAHTQSQALDDLAALFDRVGLNARREHELELGAVPSFFLPGNGLAIEVVSGSTTTAAAHRRLAHCAENEDVRAVLLLAPFLGQLEQSAALIAGKPAYFARIGRRS